MQIKMSVSLLIQQASGLPAKEVVNGPCLLHTLVSCVIHRKPLSNAGTACADGDQAKAELTVKALLVDLTPGQQE